MKSFKTLIEEFNEQHYDDEESKLHKHFKYDKSDMGHIKTYTESSAQVNGKMHALASKPEMKHYYKLSDKEQSHVNSMKDVVKKHTTPKDIHVYHGSFHAPSGGEVTHHAFMSASLNPEEAKSFMGPDEKYHDKDVTHIRKIKIPKGSHGAYIGQHSEFPDQKEFVLHPGAKIKYSKKVTHRKGMAIWHGTLVHDGVE